MTVLDDVPPAKVHTVAGGLLSTWRAVVVVPSAALTSATPTMAQLTFEVGLGGGRPMVDSPPEAGGVAVLGLGDLGCVRGVFFAHAPSTTVTTRRTTRRNGVRCLADMAATSVDRESRAQTGW